MSHVVVQLLATLLLLLFAILASERLRHVGAAFEALAHELHDATRRHYPLHSAETTLGKVAEFIRDRLPKQLPTAALIAIFVLCAAAAWWLTR